MAKKIITKKVSKTKPSSLVESLKNSMTYTLDEETRKLLFANSEITEEEGNRVATLFESAVNAKVKETTAAVSNVYKRAFGRRLNEHKAFITEKVSGYLESVVNEWYEKNKVKVGNSFVAKRNAAIVEQIQQSFGANFAKLPERHGDVLKAVVRKAVATKSALITEQKAHRALRTRYNGQICEQKFARLAAGLADTDVEKFLKLVEHLDINKPKEFGRKAREIRESVFQSKKKPSNKASKKSVVESKNLNDASKKVLSEGRNSPEKTEKPEAKVAYDPIAAASRILGKK